MHIQSKVTWMYKPEKDIKKDENCFLLNNKIKLIKSTKSCMCALSSEMMDVLEYGGGN